MAEIIPANSINESNSMRLKNTRNGPTKTTVIAPAHKPLPGVLLIDLENKTIFSEVIFYYSVLITQRSVRNRAAISCLFPQSEIPNPKSSLILICEDLPALFSAPLASFYRSPDPVLPKLRKHVPFFMALRKTRICSRTNRSNGTAHAHPTAPPLCTRRTIASWRSKSFCSSLLFDGKEKSAFRFLTLARRCENSIHGSTQLTTKVRSIRSST
jgi:hypothetical protein